MSDLFALPEHHGSTGVADIFCKQLRAGGQRRMKMPLPAIELKMPASMVLGLDLGATATAHAMQDAESNDCSMQSQK